MGVLGDMIVRIKGDTGQLTQSLGMADKSVKKFAKFIMGGAGIAGAILVFRQLGRAVVDVVKLIGEQEEAEGKLRSAIRATGRETTISVAAIAGLADQLQRTTIYGDEATLSAAAMLQQLSDLDEEGLKALIPRVQNFASAMGVDLQTAASLVGKTLGSSTNALTRYGVVVDMSGDKTQKLNSLIAAMDDKFAGMAETIGQTTTGKLEMLKNQFSDLKQELAFNLLPTINQVLSGLNAILTNITSYRSAKDIMSPEGFRMSTVNVGSAKAALDVLNAEIARTEELLKTETRYAGVERARLEQLRKKAHEIRRLLPMLEEQRQGAEAALTATGAAIELTKEEEEARQKAWEALRGENDELQEFISNQMEIVEGFPAMTRGQLGLTDVVSGFYDELESREPVLETLSDERIAAINAEVDAAVAGLDEQQEAWAAYWEEHRAIQAENLQKEKDAAQKHEEELKTLKLAALDTFGSVTGSMAAISNNYYAGILDNENLTDEQRKKIMREQAKKQKAFNLFQAIINTARAIAEALPNIPLSILAGITGAAQIAAIGSTPLPKLAKGGKLIRPTVFMGGEAGPEYVVPELALDELGGRIAGALRSATINNTITNDQPIVLSIKLDGRQLDAHVERSISNRKILVRRDSVA